MAGEVVGVGAGLSELIQNPPHPNPLPQEREPIFMQFKPEFDSISQVDGFRYNASVSPLSFRRGS